MAVMDRINDRFGRDSIVLANTGIAKPWRIHSNHRTARCTSEWSELRTVKDMLTERSLLTQ